MHLKGVEIYGFKSFGERVKIDFDGGITSIVGPNGSGKSNILDGILWVLGEQSYKNIRAKESKDILFSGGEGKKPAAYAEVSLYIDNRDNFFPIEVEDIKITRKMSQSGENDYLINDKKVRLKDIGELFLDTGVGKSAYSVIGQGKVERIISSSTKEIKGIIEEAAGVKKFQYKKLEAEKRLEKVQSELEKIQLVLDEIGENKDRVEKQSRKAIEYLEIKTNKNILQKGVLNFDLTSKEKIIEVGEKENERLSILVSQYTEELNKIEKETKEIEDKRKSLNEKIESFTKNNEELKNEIESLEKEEIRTKERVSSFERELEQRDEDLKVVEKYQKQKEENILKLKSEKENTQEKVLEIENKNKDFENKIGKEENQKKDLEISIELKRKKIMDLEVEKLKLLNEIENTTRRAKGSEFKLNNLKEDLNALDKKEKENKEEFIKVGNTKKERELQLKEGEERHAKLEAELTEISKNINKVSEMIRNAEFEEKRDMAKLQGLYRIEESKEGFYKGVKAVLNESIPGVEGAVISLIDVPEEYQKAVEASISGNLQDIVVATSEVAKKGIALLKEKKVGRASFLALDTIKVGSLKDIPKISGVIGRGSDIIKIDKKYTKVLEMLLGNVLFVETVEVALDILKKNLFSGNIVTIGGELLSGRGRLTGGETTNSIVSQMFERKKEITHLEESVKANKEKLKVWHEKMENMNLTLEKYEDELDKIDESQEPLRKEIKELGEKEKELEERYEKLLKERRVLELEIKEEENYSNEYSKRIENSKSEKDVTEKVLISLKEEIEKENEEIQKLNQEIEKLKNEFSDIRIIYLNSKDRLEQIEKDIRKEREEEKENLEKKEKNINIIEKIKKELENLQKKSDTISEEIKTKITKFENEHKELKDMKDQDSLCEERERNLLKLSRETESKLIKEKEVLNREVERKERILKEIEEVKKELEELVEVELIEIKEEELKSSRIKVRELEDKLKNFGYVNLLSIEEYKELDKKYTYIDNQKEDLIKGEKSLSILVKDIDKTIEEKFYEAYNQINKNFNEMCMETLDNSEGSLSLNDSEDFEKCGVEIMVKYKNKKRQSLSLLSGGEKSMVAIAFIMAIFMYKPSPFTFLDEIEAALDEKNTKKLIAKLKDFTDKSQFILITHNKETMKASDSLYGVTMNKKIGISKLVPVKI